MVKSKCVMLCDGVEISLRDAVEMYAIGVCQDIKDKEDGIKISNKCKILDSLSNALLLINTSDFLHVIATNMENPEIKISKEEIAKSVNSALERAIRDIDEESQQKQKRTFQT